MDSHYSMLYLTLDSQCWIREDFLYQTSELRVLRDWNPVNAPYEGP